MLQFNIKGDNVEVTPAIREFIEKKVDKIERYFPEGTNATAMVNLKAINHSQTKVEVTIPMKNLVLRAEERHDELYAAVDLIVGKLERQIRKYKTKINRKFRERDGMGMAFAIAEQETRPTYDSNADLDEDDDDIKIVRTKQFDLKPMDEEEAVLQMNMLGHNFFVFTDAESNGTNIVYKRKDGSYGLIETSVE
ncbi:ribosome-associated translation inhibitor RaiA [Planococcus shenhongbingii]|uniref:Ribosome hibernation promoting factor n=1 Tax=Planococcus shenhongbingii TaxID=3058398 RepID=A0ABT8N983_9BACL|nr:MULTISPECIES: ribosome-associated translation inhibitor RaiA [unclassified Planococcus (in: firmicutes)]MDN7244441.1 ribosome-associated translation inhibitor RaiA [Planococcus sp. N017]WKA57603.1 ribosome-associated translation inhibitor RaiA [Planococcus sp. N016]